MSKDAGFIFDATSFYLLIVPRLRKYCDCIQKILWILAFRYLFLYIVLKDLHPPRLNLNHTDMVFFWNAISNTTIKLSSF